MVKKQKSESTITTVETFRIHKNKSILSNLNEYIKHLKTKHSHMPTKQYLSLIHKHMNKIAQKKGPIPGHIISKTITKFKICKKCDKWALGTKKMIECTLCEDYFHIECINMGKEVEDSWRCVSCNEVEEKKKLIQERLNKMSAPPDCEKCSKNKNEISVKCLKCCKNYHKSCFGKAVVVCKDCYETIETKKIERQETLEQSFKKMENQSSLKKKLRITEQISESSTLKNPPRSKSVWADEEETKKEEGIGKNFKKNLEATNTFSMISNSKRFKSSFPELSQKEILYYKEKLLTAIYSKNLEYVEDLVCHECSLFDDKEESLDFALEHMSREDKKFFDQYKKQPIGPFILEYKELCGYDVIADRDLPEGMLVCEYVGDVYTHRDALELESNDSVMELKIGKNADESLFIVPTHHTNIARFINSVSNKESKTFKQNVMDVRTMYQGRPIVLLYTCRAIKKGESLLYDYQAGCANVKYDTSDYL